MKHFIKHVIAIAAVALLPVAASAQAWAPTKAITFVVPVAPGSSNDLIARMLSEKLPARLGQPVIVDNRPGASGLVGASSVARSPADGHTIVIVPSDVYMAPILSPRAGGANFDVIKDFTPILTAGSAPVLIVASPSINVKTPQELVAYLKKNGATSYGSPGTGSPMNIAGEMLKRSTGTQLNHVPYRGVLPAVNAVLAGELPISIVALAGAAPHIAAGKLVPVGLVENKRSELIPTLPTMTESGVPGVETAVFFQILAPSGTPAPVIQRLNTEINAILATPDFKDKLRGMGVQIAGGSSADAAKLARDTYARNQQLVRELKITAE
ncbi:MAG: tripartite tricarboxylate transporter substrate binding protein [Polaromonas sp.]|uniref:Bug family tripartite tricarboxylate transporter substrate binding protein n=1 Tax=Polaromonas sp. TaxID=1869339 RepID=UPI0025EF372F|nr:tripartite tricarboxylate transporter substrate-binding protein [Polaromonas sp.]MBI2728595.1 tripartite tricarboxylate transporter substrate binding protein [Polaromonas sp.]